MTHYTNHARLAIAIGGLATTGALAILLAEPIGASWHGDHTHWRLDHFLLPMIVTITIAAGHLCGKALREMRPAALGFAGLFLVGTLLTVYSSVGAQRAAGDLRSAQAAADNKGLAAKWADLERAKSRLTMAETMADREMAGGRCGRPCQDWKLRSTEIGANIERIERDIRAMGAEKVAPPGKAAAFAEAIAVLGYDRHTIERLARTFEPFAFALLFELTAIVAFGYGFGGRPAQSAAAGNVLPFRRPEAITERDEGNLSDEEIADVKRIYSVSPATLQAARDALAKEPGLSNDELAHRIGKSAATASKAASVLASMGHVERAKLTTGDCRKVAIG